MPDLGAGPQAATDGGNCRMTRIGRITRRRPALYPGPRRIRVIRAIRVIRQFGCPWPATAIRVDQRFSRALASYKSDQPLTFFPKLARHTHVAGSPRKRG